MFAGIGGFGEMFGVGLHRDVPPGRFDPLQLRVGTAIEMEHTRSRADAVEIAKDHLVEDERYYYKLCRYVEPGEPKCRPLLRGKKMR